ncbi:MAG: shikimate kinase [Clostridiaceae bacterium]|nr:shikimate kinase [Clostridiaceae bacterium]
MATVDKIILIGMPGSGKSTAGLLLARSICCDFIDTDLIIQKKAGLTLQRIIDQRGMTEFLNLEEDVLLNLPTDNIPMVIATGGSAVLSEYAMRYLKSLGILVWLDVPLDILKRRLKNIKSRGIAMAAGQTIDELMSFRLPLYARYADIRVNTAGNTLEETVEQLMYELEIHKCEY